jgi:hypothetical protein
MKIFTCLNINDVKKYFSISSSILDIVRVPEEVAREMLLHNENVINTNVVYYFQIKQIGLGICAIRLLPHNIRLTILLNQTESWINS